MHRLIVAAATAIAFAATATADAPPPREESCAMKKSSNVSFRTFSSKDVMELVVDGGPCNDAKLYIFIRTDKGEVLYKYEAPLEQHLVIASDPISVEAQRFVDGVIKEGMLSTETLPPWKEPEAYKEEHLATIFLSKKAYESLRTNPRPMLSHPTYHEGWRVVVYDPKGRAATTVLEGGT